MGPALVAFALATYADPDGTKVRPSQQTVATGLGVSRSTVTRAVQRLREDGYLLPVREAGPGLTAEYRLSLPVGAPLHGEGAAVHPFGAPVHGVRAAVPQHQTKDQTTYQTTDQTSAATAVEVEDPWDEAERLAVPAPVRRLTAAPKPTPHGDPWAED